MFKVRLILALVLISAATSLQAVPPPRQFVLNNTQLVPLHSTSTGQDHELVVSLPASYAEHPERTYPVLYYLDAYWDTPLLSSIYGSLWYDKEVPEFIMVGLSYPAGANYDSERRRDYTYTAEGPGSGKAAAFLDFIRKEVAPLIESNYHAEATGRVIAGSSLGGLFSLYSAYAAPGFFAGHIAISPAVAWDDRALMKLDAAHAQAHKPLNGRVFLSYGGAETARFREPIAAYQKQLAGRRYKGLALQNYKMEGLDHASVKADGYVRGLMWVWKDRKPAGPSGLTAAMGGK